MTTQDLQAIIKTWDEYWLPNHTATLLAECAKHIAELESQLKQEIAGRLVREAVAQVDAEKAVVPQGYAVVNKALLRGMLREVLGEDGTVYQRIDTLLENRNLT